VNMSQEEMAVHLAEVEARSKSNSHRIDQLEKNTEALNKLATAVEVMATKQDTMAETLDRLDAKVETIEQKPAKRWDGMVEKFVAGLVGALATLIFAGIVYLIKMGVGG